MSIANQPSHYVSIWDFLIPGPILYLKQHYPPCQCGRNAALLLALLSTAQHSISRKCNISIHLHSTWFVTLRVHFPYFNRTYVYCSLQCIVYCMDSVHSSYSARVAVYMQCTLRYTAGTLHLGLGWQSGAHYVRDTALVGCMAGDPPGRLTTIWCFCPFQTKMNLFVPNCWLPELVCQKTIGTEY